MSLAVYVYDALFLATAAVVIYCVKVVILPLKAERQKKAEDAKQELKDIAVQSKGTPLSAVVPLDVPAGATQGGNLETLTIGQKVELEITRATASARKRAIITKGTTTITADRFGRAPKGMFIVMKIGGRPCAYWTDPSTLIEYTDPKGKKHVKLFFDLLHSEPLGLDGNLKWSDELEMVLADSAEDQYVAIASADLAFRFTRTLGYAMLLVGFLSVVLGIAVNGAAHLIPIVQIRWIP